MTTQTPKKPRKKQPSPAQDKIEAAGGIDALEEAMRNDVSIAQYAKRIGVSVGVLFEWMNKTPERSARAKAARIFSSQTADDLALKVLDDLKPDSTQAEVARAREMASHYRWRARVRNPAEYGDKIEATVIREVSKLSDDELEAEAAALLARMGKSPEPDA